MNHKFRIEMNALQKSLVFIIVVFTNIIFVQCDGRVCLPLRERNGEEKYEVIDYKRITDPIEAKINQVMKDWRLETSRQYQVLEQKQESEFAEKFADIEKELAYKVTSNETITCPILPNSRSNIPDELCVIRRKDACFWYELHRSNDITFSRAKEICARRNSTVGVIPDRSVYDEIKKSVIPNIPRGRQYVDLWVNLKIDMRTGQIIYPDPDVYTYWDQRPRLSESGSSDPRYISVFMASRYGGMRITSATNYFSGVICQI